MGTRNTYNGCTAEWIYGLTIDQGPEGCRLSTLPRSVSAFSLGVGYCRPGDQPRRKDHPHYRRLDSALPCPDVVHHATPKIDRLEPGDPIPANAGTVCIFLWLPSPDDLCPFHCQPQFF